MHAKQSGHECPLEVSLCRQEQESDPRVPVASIGRREYEPGTADYEDALRKSEERFPLVAGVTGEAIWDNDLTIGVQEWDGATEALFGYPPHEGRTGEWWEERIHPVDRGRVLSGLAQVLKGNGEAWEEGYRFRQADGSYAHVHDRGRVVRDANGNAVRMVGFMRDVTERRRQQVELRQSEELLRTTFEAAAVGMAHISPDGGWLRINDRLCEISGYGREDLLGMTLRDLALPEDLEASEERVRQLLTGEIGSYTVERRFVRKDGRRVWINLSVSLVRKASGDPDHLVCVADDITGSKIRELLPEPLTLRETEVLERLVVGSTDPQISLNLSYSLGTVKRDVRRVLAKLRVQDHKAAAQAVEIGLALHRRNGSFSCSDNMLSRFYVVCCRVVPQSSFATWQKCKENPRSSPEVISWSMCRQRGPASTMHGRLYLTAGTSRSTCSAVRRLYVWLSRSGFLP